MKIYKQQAPANSDLIWRKKKALAPQRHRPEFLARNEAFLVDEN